jgi:very-short-patch-repair endonuclease
MPTRAQKLRKNPTPAEVRFWRVIEPLRLGGYHFRKQAPLGPYVADFACHHAKIVIEIDGDSHFAGNGPQRDAVRTKFLEGEGYRVLRFTNIDVMTNPDGVYDAVLAALEADQTHVR